jgi:MFS family permease
LRSAACYNLTACSGSGAPRHPKRVAPASAAGGILFGVIADRWGRTRALSLSILIYSVFTAACGFACNVTELAIYRVFLGIGFGGEWASGAALVSETWPPEHRGKALGLMQSCWAIGYAAAAIVTALVLPRFGWRAVFFVGVVPALFTLWIRRRVPEPEVWRRARVELFGFVSDRLGRKPSYVTYLVAAAILVLVDSVVRSPIALLLLGPFVAFFGTGYFSGFGAVTAELYPTTIRATAQGFTYNLGRLASAVAPFVVGAMAQERGFGIAFTLTSVAFLIAAGLWAFIPETRGRQLA